MMDIRKWLRKGKNATDENKEDDERHVVGGGGGGGGEEETIMSMKYRQKLANLAKPATLALRLEPQCRQPSCHARRRPRDRV